MVRIFIYQASIWLQLYCNVKIKSYHILSIFNRLMRFLSHCRLDHWLDNELYKKADDLRSEPAWRREELNLTGEIK